VLQWGLRGLTLAIPLATLSGYVALARLLATHGVLTLGLVFFVGAMIGIGEQAVAAFMLPQARLGQGLRGSMGLTDEDTEMLVFWWRAVFRLLLLFLGLGGLLLLWSVDTKDLLLLCMEFLNGFRIGHISIQPTAILLGIVLFAVFLMTTRLIQRSLDLRIFPRTRLDVGARHSIRSAVGYFGFSLAALLGVSVMGVDLSNLAIIAGALSVGIGFGLQNIVNNFVSGLILLIERPIKTGDWVMVGEYQGYVKNISVRATEITTFDRASVFIPNSSLISGAVLNRTHADRLGRVMLPLRVDPQMDPERVRRILLDMAAAIPEIKQTPSPLVFFTALDETMLSLELVALVRDVEGVKEVTSQLLVEIHRRFQREGIGYRAAPDRGVSVTLQEDQLKDVLQSLKR
jgi:small-conductance mechanosensitive channel